MKEKAAAMEKAAEELERRSRYLSSLVQQRKRAEEGGVDLKGSPPTAGGGKKDDGSAKDEDLTKKVEGEVAVEDKDKDKARKKAVADDSGDLERNVRVRASDMPPELQKRAFRSAREVLASMPKLDSKRLALTLKKEFDSAYGPAWHCIVGTSFGSYVTHSLGGFLYFSIDKVYILLFRTAVAPLDH